MPVENHYERLALHPDGAWLAGAGKEPHSIDLWSVSRKDDVLSPTTIPGSEYFTFSPDRHWLATCWDGKFQFYRVGAWQKPAFAIPRNSASRQFAPIAFTRDGSTVALAASRYTIQLLRLPKDDSTSPRSIANLESPDRSPLEILAFSPDGQYLAAGTKDGFIQLWNLVWLGESLADLSLQKDWLEYP